MHLTTEYRQAVNKAYAMRLRYAPNSLPFDPFLPISVSDHLRVCKYSTFLARCGQAGLPAPLAREPDGFTLVQDGPKGLRCVIVYNDAQSPARQRFTLAHELGHIVLGHREDSPENDALADCFARNLLTPALYAQRLGLPVRLYPRTFLVSAAAARAAERHFPADLEAIWPSTARRVEAGLRALV